MAARQKIIFLGLQVSLIIALFSLGCATIKNKTANNAPVLRKKITDDAKVFIDLRQLDMDNDGEKDILALYITRDNLRGVKIIKSNNKGEGQVLFKQLFFTNNARIEIKHGIPLIIVKEISPFSWFAKNKIYRWNGKGFVS